MRASGRPRPEFRQLCGVLPDSRVMTTLTISYSRIDAIAEGRLLDVSHLNRPRSNPYPTFVSVGLWEACRRERPSRHWGVHRRPGERKRVSHEDRIREVITLLPLFR